MTVLEPLLESPAATEGAAVVGVGSAELCLAVVLIIAAGELTLCATHDGCPDDVAGLAVGHIEVYTDGRSLGFRGREVHTSTEDLDVDTGANSGGPADGLRRRDAWGDRASVGTYLPINYCTLMLEGNVDPRSIS